MNTTQPNSSYDNNVSINNGNMDVYSSHKNILLQLHNEAPRPLRVDFNEKIERPPYFGSEFHGVVTAREAELLLEREGQYLVRKRKNQKDTTLSFKVNGSIHHYRLFYDGKYFIKSEKKFSSLYNLVAEGLLINFLERNAESYFIMTHPIPEVVSQPTSKLTRSLSDCGRANSHQMRMSYWLMKCTDCNSLVLVAQKCNKCGYRHHANCKRPFMDKCTRRKSIFGGELNDADFHIQSRPFILQMCIEEIEKRGLDEAGIYRVSGFSEDIEKLSTEFDRDQQNTKLCSYSVHVVAGVLKRWLRKLPVSVIPSYTCTRLYDTISRDSSDHALPEIKKILIGLEAHHYTCLRTLTLHMKKVVLEMETNKMTSYNLAVVFAPALFPTDYDNIETNIIVLKYLISNCDNIFL